MSRRTYSIEGRKKISSPPDAVMAYLLDPSTWPAWQPEINAAAGPSPLSEGDVVRGNARMLGFHGVEGRSVATSAGDKFFEEDVVVGIGMTLRYEVLPDGDGSIVVQHLESNLPAGPMGRLLSLVLRWRLKRLQKTALERLAAQSEAGSS
jgi:hypothetical protein